MDDRIVNTSDKKTENGKTATQIGFGLTLSGWIAFPVLIGFFIGKYLVEKLNTPSYVFYVVLGLFVVLSFYGLIKATLRYTKNAEK